MNRVAELNGFIANARGVFKYQDEVREFNYSDGQESERYLFDVLSQAQDLSSSSRELQAAIRDWPSEYHLSPARANLLRALNLNGVRRVLELGCGCGAVTRYLAEQPGITIDSVEGSRSRAGLAALRCRDQQNVEICTANFNDIALPENEYDLVLFVGVTEYAGRFSDLGSDQAALQALLAMGRRACKSDGVVLVAIENRLGIKYALGANEDHYAVPFVGLDHYPESSGIRTYSLNEWQHEIDMAGFTEHSLYLPFPDYKVPTAVIHQTAPGEDAYCAIKQRVSRDYLSGFDLGENEYRVWQAFIQAGTLAQHSNSFLWLMGNSAQAIKQMSEKVVSTFEVCGLGYDMPSSDLPQRPEDRKLIEHLEAKVVQLESHTEGLSNKVDIMSNSIGWRVLNLIRRLLGKTTL